MFNGFEASPFLDVNLTVIYGRMTVKVDLPAAQEGGGGGG